MQLSDRSLDLDTGKYDDLRETGLARRYIAYWLLAILTLVVVLSLVALAWAISPHQGSLKANFDHIVGLLNIVFGPVVTLVGTATGFYFGAQSAKRPQPTDTAGKTGQ